MLRTCPKCGDYYADGLLAFCLLDGTPLESVDPLGESWREGARVVEEKENALRKQRRRLKWRRFLLRAVTMLMAIMVVSVVIVNSLIYLKLLPEDKVTDKLATQTLTPIVSETPTPTPDTESRITPSPTPSPTPRPTTDPAICSDADKKREEATLVKRFDYKWQQNMAGEPPKVAGNSTAGAPQYGFPTARPRLASVTYDSAFSKTCTEGVVTARALWEVKTNVNGAIKVSITPREKKFRCVKSGGIWFCN
jgi:hypothetical protein